MHRCTNEGTPLGNASEIDHLALQCTQTIDVMLAIVAQMTCLRYRLCEAARVIVKITP